MSPEAVTIEIALVEAIRLLELALLAGDTVTTGVDVLNLTSIELLKTNLASPSEQVTDLVCAVAQLNLAVSDTLALMRPLIVAFVEAQKKLLHERSNVNAMH